MKTVNEKNILSKMFSKAVISAFSIMITIWGAVFIDGLIVCKFLGADDIAAVGLVHPVILMVQMFAGCISNGLQIFSSKKIGSGKTNEVKEIFAEMYTLSIIVSLVLTGLIIGFADSIVNLLGVSHDMVSLQESTLDYIRGFAIGIPGVVLTVLFRTGMQLSDNKWSLSFASIAFLISDVILDFVAVLGNFGTFGIGLASGLSYYISLSIFISATMRENTVLSLSLRKIQFSSIAKIVTLGSENFVRRSIFIVRPLIINRLIIYFGGLTALSALSIQNNITNIINIPGNSIIMALSIITGLFYGENNEKEIYAVNRSCKKIIWMVTGGIAVILMLFSNTIAGFYASDDSDLQRLLVFAVFCIAIQLPFNTLNYARLGYLQAITQTKKSLSYTVIYNFFLVLLSVIVFSIFFGKYGVFLGFITADILMLLISRFYYSIKSGKIVLAERELSALPESFFIEPEDYIFLEVKDIEDCVRVSEQAFLFCKRHNIDSNKTYNVALCIEEWCKNIIQHGYNIDVVKTESITVFLKISQESLIVYIKDIAEKFDIVKYIESINESGETDPSKHIGIKLIQNSAKEIKYSRVLNTNMIIFTV